MVFRAALVAAALAWVLISSPSSAQTPSGTVSPGTATPAATGPGPNTPAAPATGNPGGVTAARPGAAGIAFAGHMGRRAALMIDGQPHTVAVGETVAGIKLLEVSSTTARVERDGQVLILSLGAVPAGMVARSARDLVIRAGPDGQFVTPGAINGQTVQFLVDTGASAITLSQAEADRLGLDWRSGQRTQASTANGTVPAHVVTVASVRLGDLSAGNLSAVVVPAPMPHVLLGNNFLGRFNLRRENDSMRLEPRS